MPFTGKATWSAGPGLPEIAEDVADIIGIVSPHETPLLDHLGDPRHVALSTVHEWLEDALLPNTDVIDDDTITFPQTETTFRVANGDRFRIGDQVRLASKPEVMLVVAINGNEISFLRQYGGTQNSPVTNGDVVHILGNAALEGDDAPDARFTARVRRQNYTQIFTAACEVSGSQSAVRTIGVADEMDYQKQERLRELLRDLENCVINGVASTVNPQGDATTRRTMRGILAHLATNLFTPGSGPLPEGDGVDGDLLTEPLLNAALREVWRQSSGTIDTILCGGEQKRRINEFVASRQRFVDHDDRYRSQVDVYESDFGVCRVVMSRWVPADTLLLLDSSRVSVMPLAGRSFGFKPLAAQGDADKGQLIGEYTLELMNENAHASISGLGTALNAASPSPVTGPPPPTRPTRPIPTPAPKPTRPHPGGPGDDVGDDPIDRPAPDDPAAPSAPPSRPPVRPSGDPKRPDRPSRPDQDRPGKDRPANPKRPSRPSGPSRPTRG